MDNRVSQSVVVKIESTIIDDRGESTEMTLFTEAKYSNIDKKAHLMYQETEVSGMEGTKTLLTYDGEQLHIKRYGNVNSALSIRLDEWVDNVYKTPYGIFLMKTYGKIITWENDERLWVEAVYDLEMENGDRSVVQVKIVAQGE